MVVAGAAAAIAAGSVSQARTGQSLRTTLGIGQHFATSILEIRLDTVGACWCTSHCHEFVCSQAFVASPAPRATPIQAEALQSRPGVPDRRSHMVGIDMMELTC